MKDQAKDRVSAHARNISAAAEEVGALILGVEGMIADQRHLMTEANASKYLQESELWGAMEVLLVIMRRTADQIEADGTAIQNEAMAA